MNTQTDSLLLRTGLRLAAAACVVPFLWACSSDSDPAPQPPRSSSPNILLIVFDDIGVDQFPIFGYGGATPPKTPTIDRLAMAGLRFRNTWSMPTCTPTRANLFEGRYPFRTDIMNAIVATDLANSQVSPFAITTPKLLKERGYVSALIGKMHLSGSDLNPANNPFGNRAMRELGWDYFYGYMDGAPYPIDTTAGGVAPGGGEGGPYACGFVPNTRDDPEHGADAGACYAAAGGCTELTTLIADTPGRACLEQGGIFDPGRSCQASRPAYLDFATQNGYYTGEWVLNGMDGSVRKYPASHPESRGYRTQLETDRAIAWIQERSPEQPWMLSLGYSAIHTPLQPLPESLLSPHSVRTSGFNCEDLAQQRILSNQMIEGMDTEIGRLLVETGLATRRADGTLDYRPDETDTVIVMVGDNGTYAPSVKLPFDFTRAKGYPYQTGVWVPLVVSGPMINEPGRNVEHMINVADMYRLFAEIAGIDLDDTLPPTLTIDAEPVMPYLLNPDQASIRTTNFTQMGANIGAAEGSGPPPCVLPAYNVCVEIFPQKGVCEDQSGLWYGPNGVAGPEGLSSCCAVNDYRVAQGQEPVDAMPQTSSAIRNDHYKLVRFETESCEVPGLFETTNEFYVINQNVPVPKLDTFDSNLLAEGYVMTPQEHQNYVSLSQQFDALLASRIDCPGDGNGDLRVDHEDLANWEYFSQLNEGRSSWYDFNHDGLTNQADLAIIQQNLGLNCAVSGSSQG